MEVMLAAAGAASLVALHVVWVHKRDLPGQVISHEEGEQCTVLMLRHCTDSMESWSLAQTRDVRSMPAADAAYLDHRSWGRGC